MFGLKFKSWMEAHLGRPRHKSTSHQNQKRVPKDSISSSTSVAASTSHCSSSVIATSATSISTSSSSTNTSCSNGSTTTAIAGLTTGLASNNPTFPSTTSDHLTHHQEKNSNFQTRSSDFTTSSTTTTVSPSVGSESVTALGAAAVTVEGLVKDGGGVCIISKQKGDASGTRLPEIESHALGESDHHEQVPANCSSNNSNGCSRPTVTTSVSNSTSILSGSFSNSLSSPDTGYSTDGYSPKSVYPALSFDSSSSTSSGNCKSTTSTSKSSYTISSLASSELLHPSKQTSTILSSMGESCSVQNDFDEHPSTAPSPSSPAALTSSTPFSQSCSSGISTGTSDSSNNGFPKGPHQVHHHHTQLETSPRLLVQPKTQQHSITEDELKKQVIIGGDVEVGGQKKPSIETRCLELSQQKLSPAAASSLSKEDIATARVADSLTKQFAQFSIDFKNQDIISAKHNGRTHRRAESMDARTPSHEDYKPLVQDEDETGCGDDDGGGNSSLVMTGTQGKNIRTSFIINGSGHVVEFSSYKNAYSICSPRRERTRIKTNPWLILKPNSGNSSDKESHANPQSNSSASEEESADKRESVDKMKSSSFIRTASSKPIIPLENGIIETIKGREGDRDGGESGNIGKTDHTLGSIDPRKANNLEINKRVEENGQHETKLEEDDEQFTEDETGIIDHGSSSSLLFRISTSASASDSGKGTLEPTTNRNSTESSCLLSDSTTASTRNSIISHETEPSGSRSGRSSSGESISSSHQHRQVEDDTLGHASTASPDTRLFTSEHQKKQHQHIHQRVTVSSSNTAIISTTSFQEESRKNIAPSSEGGSEEPRTFRNAAVATDMCAELSSSAAVKFPKSASVSVGVGTTGSNKSGKFQPIMVDKETDILSDWGNTDEDGDEEIETDGDRNDNETVTPAPSSPDVDRALFSQSTSSATDIDFGDSSAATQASSTAVFPPSSLIRQPHRFSSGGGNNNNNGKSGGGGGNRENGARFHYSNNEGNGFSNGNDGGSGEALIATSQMLPGSYDHQHHYQHGINVNLATAPAAGSGSCYPSVPIIRPVLAAVAQHQGPNGIPDAYTYDIAATNSGPGVLVNHCSELVNHHHTLHPHVGSELAAMYYGGGVVPNFNLEDDESVYPQIKGSSNTHSKGIARGALGFLRKIFKKGACSSQRHSPDSVKGKKSRGKSDNNLASLGLGSPLLTISEPLSNPRYSAVLTSKKQMNPALNSYFLTPTPNSFRRKSGTGTDSSDSKSSKQNSSGKSVKTDIIRLPQGTLSPTQQQSLLQRQTVHATSSSHSSGSSCSGLSGNGIPVQTCSTFFSPGSTNFHHQLSASAQPGVGPVAGVGNNSNLASSQSNTNTNSTSGSSSVHSLMSTSTSAASVGNNGNLNRPPSQNQSKTPVPSRDPNYYANSSPIPRQSVFMPNNGNCNSNNIARGNSHRMSPPPLISEHSPYLSDGKNPQHQNPIHSHGSNQGAQSSCRRDHHPHSQSPAMRSVAPYESPRLPASSSSAATAASARMNSPSFNNYSPIHKAIHRLVVTEGTHLLNRANPNCPAGNPPAANPAASSTGLVHYPQSGIAISNNRESPLPVPRSYSNLHSSGVNGNNNGNGAGNNNNPAGFPMNSQIVNRPGSHHHHATSSPSPLINHRYPSTSSPHQYPSTISSSQQQQQSVPGHFFASPSPILRNPRYQYITSSNQNSPILNTSKRLNMLPPSHSHSHVQILASSNGLPSNPNGPPPLLTTFAPLPSSQLSSSSGVAPRESLINNNSFNANTITGSPNLNSSDPFSQRTRQVVSSSLSYNEFENLSRQQQTFLFPNNGNNSQQHHLPISATPHPPPSSHHQHIISQPQQQQLLHQSQKGKIHHQNHYYSSPIVKGVHPPPSSLKQTFWNSSEEQGRILCGNNEGTRQHQQRMNQNLRFNSFLVGHRQLPRFYHTQWGLQERIYETVDSDGEHTASDEMSAVGAEYDQDGNEIDRTSELSLPVEVHPRMMKHGFNPDEAERLRVQEGNFLLGQRESSTMRTSNVMGYNPDSIAASSMIDAENQEQTCRSKSKRSKPKSLSASGKPLPRPVVALPMMPGTFLSETETRLLEADKESDRKYKRLINEAEALLKEISVEKCKRSGTTHDNNPFRLEDCPQSDPLRRKAYDCWALRRLQQELAGCCASPPVLHRSRLNLQSPLTPTVTNNPFLSHFQQMGHPSLPQQVPYMNSSGVVDNNQNSFEF